ncbi:Fc.00g099970.m01.CDS01 [Cosmosporella sp. VM-42]
MAAFFQSFRSSTMPKRLLRYALSRLELLDADALDIENLDFALGRNTVFEFRDVGVKLKKLEKLLQLPAKFSLQKAKVLLLRVTIPMDFYTSPITVEVDGVDIKFKVLGPERKPRLTPGATTPSESTIVPNTVDLAQSFLQTQPSSERRQLEDALAAETQDLGASISISDDGSEDDLAYGTGQPLSLPVFLADFLQGIVDRTQVKIKGVTFQLDLEVPLDPNSTGPEPVSFQIALEAIEIEGVTTQSADRDGSPTIVPKEGKRHISLANIRAYLISEANVFSTLARSPSMTSPSVPSSPAATRNPPSRQSTVLPQDSSQHDPLPSLQGSFTEQHLDPDLDEYSDHEYPLGDSEEALAIPYEFSDPLDEAGDESPATPKASMYHDFNNSSPEEPLFHSTILPTDAVSHSAEFEEEQPLWGSIERESRSAPTVDLPIQSTSNVYGRPLSPEEQMTRSATRSDSSGANSTEDLARSQMYTHEEAESMYMSAFSQTNAQSTATISPAISCHQLPPQESTELIQPQTRLPETTEVSEQTEPCESAKPITKEPASPPAESQTPPTIMPGGWGDNDSPPHRSSGSIIGERLTSSRPYLEKDAPQTDVSDSETSSPAFSRASLADVPVVRPSTPEPKPQDDVETPKGPTRLVKEILNLKNISIYVPSQHQHIQVQAASPESVAQLSQSLGRSIYPQAPGAFSVHGTAASQSPPTSTTGDDNVLEVALSPISINFDTSLGFLLSMVVGKLLEAIKDDKPQSATGTGSQEEPMKKVPEVKVTLQEVSLNFLNRLGGVSDTPERYLDPSAFIFEQEVLLNTTLQNVAISISPVEVPTQKAMRNSPVKQIATLTKIDVQKFRFGYANGDIISFDSGRPMSTSVRDTFLSSGTDIGIKILQARDYTETDIETLPLFLQIDLQRLDETFSWFGGLSSFLNMSASMTSSPSPTPKSTPLLLQKAKGVRFDTPIDLEDDSAASMNKINVRVGGSYVELVGKDCSVSAKTTSIRLISREEFISMACNMVRASGPYLKNSSAVPAINTEISGVRLDFLTKPEYTDLERLLELITPSKVKFDNDKDEIMVDTLIKQREKGSVLRVSVETANIRVQNMAQLSVIPNLGEEISKLATVAKYLPEDDRPGLLTLGKIQKVGVSLDFDKKIGHLSAELQELQVGHITIPSLVAIAVDGISVKRNKTEELVSSSPFGNTGPVLMARMIGDEIEPVIKLKMQDLCIEYRVSTVMDLLDLAEDATPQDFEASLAASVANLGDQAHNALAQSPVDKKASKPMTLDIGFCDCLVGLNPLGLTSKLVIAFTDAHLNVVLPKGVETSAELSIRKASILLIDDISAAAVEGTRLTHKRHVSSSRQVEDLCQRGFADICLIKSAKAVVNVRAGEDGEKQLNVELRDDLLVLQTCADSTQTLITLANALKPPTPPSKQDKYRTNVIPVQDLLASISAEAFGQHEGEYDFEEDFAGALEMAGSDSDAEYNTDSPLQVQSQYYQDETAEEALFDATSSSILPPNKNSTTRKRPLLTGLSGSSSQLSGSTDSLVIHEDYYGVESGKDIRAKVWNRLKNRFDTAPNDLIKRSPLKVSVRDVHIIWNLHDGYDWNHTRDVITKAVQEVENKAFERQRAGPAYEDEEEEEEAIGDFLFNSIYIGIPANRDPQELARAINAGLNVNDTATETESVATTAFTASTNRTMRTHQPRSKRLKLKRSQRHKISFELQGVNADLFLYPEGKTVSSVDVRVDNLEIIDNVPTSTWKKFATYDRDMGEREMGTSMVHLDLVTVKPIAELSASEIILQAKVLPLRLHVDQDALDFITRFFEFKDDNVPVHASPSDIPFIQRAEIHNIPVQLDFKPKRVDYAGLRSGHTTEFMNFITLDQARMVLRHAILHGVPGFDRLGNTLNDIWMPDVKANQLPTVLAGLAPVRPFVNVGSGVRELFEVPIREYKKDGRVIRSISKGAAAFARTTGTELVKLGAKLAVGTQNVLQGAEGLLTEQPHHEPLNHWDDEDLDPEERKQISLYADQPTGVLAGIRGGYRSLTRDINVARDAIIAVPGEIMESQSAGSAARAVWRHAPTIIIRPAVGVTKAIGQTLMGATNSMDPENRRRIEEKYKRH